MDKLPPTGIMLTSSLVELSPRYSIDKIKKGITRDYKFAGNCLREVASQLNNCSRDFGASGNLRNEFNSIEQVRIFATQSHIDISTLSQKAQDVIKKGTMPLCRRALHLKELDYVFPYNKNPLVLSTRRRKASLESKVAKTLVRIAQYRNSEVGREDTALTGILNLLSELDSNEYNLTFSKSKESELYSTIAEDFAGVTYLINGYKREGDKLVEEMDRGVLAQRLQRVYRTASVVCKKAIVLNSKNNFKSNIKDRSFSFTAQKTRNGATYESRIIFPRDFIEATIGDRSHDEYKVAQRRIIEQRMAEDLTYKYLVNRSLLFVRCSNLDELYLR